MSDGDGAMRDEGRQITHDLCGYREVICDLGNFELNSECWRTC